MPTKCHTIVQHNKKKPTETIGADFVRFVVGLIEQPPAHVSTTDDELDQLSDVLINLLIALNQQFDEATAATDNVVVLAMRDVPVAKTFTEKILVLLNRDGGSLAWCLNTVRVFLYVLVVCYRRGSAPALCPCRATEWWWWWWCRRENCPKCGAETVRRSVCDTRNGRPVLHQRQQGAD